MGARLRSARRTLGLTRKQVAQRLGVARDGHLSRWETGRRIPTLGTLAALAALYCKPIEYFVGVFWKVYKNAQIHEDLAREQTQRPATPSPARSRNGPEETHTYRLRP